MLTQSEYSWMWKIMPEYNWFWSPHGQCWCFVDEPNNFSWSNIHWMAYYNHGKSDTIMQFEKDGKEIKRVTSKEELVAFLETIKAGI